MTGSLESTHLVDEHGVVHHRHQTVVTYTTALKGEVVTKYYYTPWPWCLINRRMVVIESYGNLTAHPGPETCLVCLSRRDK